MDGTEGIGEVMAERQIGGLAAFFSAAPGCGGIAVHSLRDDEGRTEYSRIVAVLVHLGYRQAGHAGQRGERFVLGA